MVAYTLIGAVVAVYERGIGGPRMGGLVAKFLAVGVVGCNTRDNRIVDGGLNNRRNARHERGYLANIL